eukprot:scaffold106292_cov48-Phaeocystis_antarctica.AAC.2
MTGVSIRCVSHCKLVSWPRASSASVSTCRCSARIRCSTITRPTVHVTVTAVLKRSPDPTITNASIQPPNQPPRALWRLSLGSANCGREPSLLEGRELPMWERGCNARYVAAPLQRGASTLLLHGFSTLLPISPILLLQHSPSLGLTIPIVTRVTYRGVQPLVARFSATLLTPASPLRRPCVAPASR